MFSQRRGILIREQVKTVLGGAIDGAEGSPPGGGFEPGVTRSCVPRLCGRWPLHAVIQQRNRHPGAARCHVATEWLLQLVRSAPVIGQVLDGKYRINRLLGEGGMGAVYEAIHLGTGRRVALKVILGGDPAHSQDMFARFQREARAAGAIDTQHIVQVLDTGADAERGLPFMVMEFLSGEDLQQVVRRVGPLSPDVVLRVAAQACVGLQKAHEAGVVHRDIKPANLFVARREAGELIVKVLDFGIAKIKLDQLGSSQNHGLTKTGSMLGSPLYMSPEQARGLKSIDQRTDIWSLGAVLYEALTGRTPHDGVDTLGQLIINICSEQPRPVQDFAPWVPPEVAAIVHGALTIDVDRRFPSASAMLEAVRALLPSGWSLDESMMTPVDDAARAVIADRFALSSPGGQLTGSYPGSAPGVVRLVSTQQTLVRTARGNRTSTVSLLFLLGAAGVVASAAVGWWRLSHRPPVEVAMNVMGSANVAPVVSGPVAPPAVETPSTAPIGRMVHVTITPPEATVEVDGKPVPVRDGAVEFEGPLGSVHVMRVAAAGRQTTGDIVITETGAIPGKLQLGAPPSRAPKAASPRPATAPIVARPAGAVSSKPAAPALEKKFE